MDRIKTAIVIAGGRGMRLRPYTHDTPKPMVIVNDKPIIHWIISWLIKNGFEKVVIGVAYQKEKIIDWFESNNYNVEIVFSNHQVESGTGGAFKSAIINGNIDDDYFLAMNGDEITDLPVNSMFNFHLRNNSIATILSTPLKSNFGVVRIDRDNFIEEFLEKPTIDDIFINSGVYIFNKSIFEYLPEADDIERTTFVKLTEMREISAFRYFGFWGTINTEKDLIHMEDKITQLRDVF